MILNNSHPSKKGDTIKKWNLKKKTYTEIAGASYKFQISIFG